MYKRSTVGARPVKDKQEESEVGRQGLAPSERRG
jgi:hypothetical protein